MTVSRTVDNLQQTWAILFPRRPVPTAQQWALWLLQHSEQTVRAAISKVAIKQQTTPDPKMNLERFASAIMTRIDRERGEKPVSHVTSVVGQEGEINGNRA